MRLLLLCVAACAAAVSAFHMPLPASRAPGTSLTVTKMAGSAYVSTKAGKAERIEKYKQLLADSELIFAVPGYGVTVAQLYKLRRSMPATTKVTMAKNTLLRVAIGDDKKWEPVSPSLEGQNLWFFVKEDDMKATFDAYAAFLKENKPLQESHTFRFGTMEGQLLDSDGVSKLSNMPSKIELYTKLAYALKQPSTKLARTLKASPTKLARAIRLSFLDDEKKDGEAASE